MVKEFIETQRLILRDWKDVDTRPFCSMNNNDLVMKYFLKKLTKEESIVFLDKIKEEIKTYGYGLFAVEEKKDHQFIGLLGLHRFDFDAGFSPGIEIGWRMLPGSWGKGYATEAAKACLEFARDQHGINEIWSFTSILNKASERVMQKAGMLKIKEFDHPQVPSGHELQRHVLYRKDFIK